MRPLRNDQFPTSIQGEAGIEIVRDTHGVPHVSARTQADLFRGLGYCHGTDRGLQVLLTRVLVQGRASEVLEASDEMLRMDVFFRRLNFRRAAEGEASKLGADDRSLLEAYCGGVNDALRRRRPWELRLVRYRPEPWTPADSVALVRATGYVQMAQHQADMERLLVEMVQAGVPRDHLEELFGGRLDGLDVGLLGQVRLGERLVSETVRWAVGLPHVGGSNNWVISAGRSASGHAILASDPHLEANRLPAVWYETVLELSGRWCIAGTIPGVPSPAVGRTNDLAWAPTYACMDAIDSWIEDCRSGHYRRGVDGAERWEPFAVRTEVIERRGKPSQTVTFHENDHGVLDGDPHQDGLYPATRWASGSDTGARSVAAGFAMLTAPDVAAGMRTLGKVEIAQNWVLADRHGDIGYQMSGQMPLRREGWSGLVPLPGWNPDNDWRGIAPASELPRQRDPQAGFIGTANHDLNHLGVRNPINLPMGVDRGARIEELLAGRDGWTVEDVESMQMDVFSRHAARFMSVLEPLLPDRAQANVLQQWDFRYDPDSRGASLFERLYALLLAEVFGRVLGDDVLRFLADQTSILAGFYALFDSVLLDEHSAWFGGEGRDAVFRRVAAKALEQPAPRWGDRQRFTMRHLMLGGKLPSWLGFDHGPVTLRGGRATIHQGQVFRLAGRETNWAPSFRMVTDFGEPAAHTTLAGGPSDRRFSRWYTSEIGDWLDGRFKTLTPDIRAPAGSRPHHRAQSAERFDEILIVGAGAAGVETALSLRSRAPQLLVTVIAPTDEVVYRPWLIHLPAGGREVRYPLAALAEQAGFRLRRGWVQQVDPGRSLVRLTDGRAVGYQRLVLAAGAPADRRRIPGSAEHALFPCDSEDAVRFADRVRELRDGVITIVLTGERTGPGLEYAANLARLLHHNGSSRLRVRVVDDRPRLMAPLGAMASRHIERLLTSRAASVEVGTPVAAIEADGLVLADGRRLESRLTAVVGPLCGPDLGLPPQLTGQDGFLRTDDWLHLSGHPEVTVIGDAAELASAPELPKSWVFARRQAVTAAANLAAEAADAPTQPFDLTAARRLAAVNLPDLGGTTVLVRSGRLLARGRLPLLLRTRLDQRNLRAIRHPTTRRQKHRIGGAPQHMVGGGHSEPDG